MIVRLYLKVAHKTVEIEDVGMIEERGSTLILSIVGKPPIAYDWRDVAIIHIKEALNGQKISKVPT